MAMEQGIKFDSTDMLLVRRGGAWLAPFLWLLFLVRALCHLDAWLVDRRPMGGRFDTRTGVPRV
jgi:hypothetical protein